MVHAAKFLFNLHTRSSGHNGISSIAMTRTGEIRSSSVAPFPDDHDAKSYDMRPKCLFPVAPAGKLSTSCVEAGTPIARGPTKRATD